MTVEIDGIKLDGEKQVPYARKEEVLFREEEGSSSYEVDRFRVPGGKGINANRFAEIVVLKHLEAEGYEVLVSESQEILNPDRDGYILGSFPGKRDPEDPGARNFARMLKHFDHGLVKEFNQEADKQKLAVSPTAVGGDPDLFAYRKRLRGDGRDRIFVEAKQVGEELRSKQRAEFPVIRAVLNCQVWVYRIVPED